MLYKRRDTIAILIIIIIVTAIIPPWFDTPEKIEPTILVKEDSICVLEYIPCTGNLFTSAYSWYNRKETFYVKDTVDYENGWSKSPEYKPCLSIYYKYNYYGDELEIEEIIDTIPNDRTILIFFYSCFCIIFVYD